jgi:hypothetical protein
VQLGELDELFKEITAEGAADAAILESDDLFLRLGQAVVDEGGVNIDTGVLAGLATAV